MALLKTVTGENGVVTTYHRICSIVNNGIELSVNIDSYVSEEYRNKEKENTEKRNQIIALEQEINEIQNDSTLSTEEKVNQTSAISEQMTTLNNEITYTSYIVSTSTYKLGALDSDTSFTDSYTRLKDLDAFLDAEDC